MKYNNTFFLLFFLMMTGLSCQSQSSSPYAPEAGIYTGGTLNVSGTMNYSYNPITGFGMQPGTSITPGPNIMGDMKITSSGANKGNYSFSKMTDWKGQWTYDPEKDKLSFTGPLKNALQYYHAGKGLYQLTLNIKPNAGDNEGVTYYFSKKSSKAFPKRSNPNGKLSGLITIKPDFNTIAFFDMATGRIQKSFAGKMAFTNPAHHTISVGFTDHTQYYQLSFTDPSGNTKHLTPATIQSYNWSFSNYQMLLSTMIKQEWHFLEKHPIVMQT